MSFQTLTYPISTDCDKTVFIKATESVTLVTEQFPHTYLPGLNCRFHLYTHQDFWLKLINSVVDIAGGSFCSGDSLQITDNGKFCRDRPLPAILYINSNKIDMLLQTGEKGDGRGVNITIVSVRK